LNRVIVDTFGHHFQMMGHAVRATGETLREKVAEMVVLPIFACLVVPYVASAINASHAVGFDLPRIAQKLPEDSVSNLALAVILMAIYLVLAFLWHWLRAPVLKIKELEAAIASAQRPAHAPAQASPLIGNNYGPITIVYPPGHPAAAEFADNQTTPTLSSPQGEPVVLPPEPAAQPDPQAQPEPQALPQPPGEH
jgi:hypothetical protein